MVKNAKSGMNERETGQTSFQRSKKLFTLAIITCGHEFYFCIVEVFASGTHDSVNVAMENQCS